MKKKPNLAEALHQATGKTENVVIPKKKTSSKKEDDNKDSNPNEYIIPPSRKGKKIISSYFDPAVSQQLKYLCIERDSTIQNLMSEALNDLFVKYEKKPIA